MLSKFFNKQKKYYAEVDTESGGEIHHYCYNNYYII